MTWILALYLLGLLFLAINSTKIIDKEFFRYSWISFALIPIAHFLFALLRAVNIKSNHNLQLVEIWSTGTLWLLLGISLFWLLGALVPNDSEGALSSTLNDGSNGSLDLNSNDKERLTTTNELYQHLKETYPNYSREIDLAVNLPDFRREVIEKHFRKKGLSNLQRKYNAGPTKMDLSAFGVLLAIITEKKYQDNI